MSSSSASSSVSSFSASSRASTPSAPKDYAAAFATLQSTYGLSGMAPSVSSKTRKAKTGTKLSASASVTSSIHSSSSEKSYESAFGTLSAQFGFGGMAPQASKSSNV
ncbi:hypothetical protein MVEN_02279200 [Mycena venus]|uniref:Uncharacterized protein n=1 Tax=Mycena venus TaxID=2733690 RepID=A0A8H7CFY0_9AGAR|nr:hypothetical protein MVEN_02279200 [Mycena venus]